MGCLLLGDERQQEYREVNGKSKDYENRGSRARLTFYRRQPMMIHHWTLPRIVRGSALVQLYAPSHQCSLVNWYFQPQICTLLFTKTNFIKHHQKTLQL